MDLKENTLLKDLCSTEKNKTHSHGSKHSLKHLYDSWQMAAVFASPSVGLEMAESLPSSSDKRQKAAHASSKAAEFVINIQEEP